MFKQFFDSKFNENSNSINPALLKELKNLVVSGVLSLDMNLKQIFDKFESKNNSSKNFESDFTRAFNALDTGYNFVKLYNLRKSLPQYSRQEFDGGLNSLRKERKFSLEASEGLLVKLTPEEKEAGILEQGRLLIYCKKINNVY
ncbi:MAG: hypothetical protein EKK64_06960 [Neisseriaceae bacterium]|nr:MAG: hypothetical protein EKK64_06960 [Neisseriaceae bacterium]